MKRSLWTRSLALILVVSMLAVPVSASGWNSRNSRNGWGWDWSSIWDYWFGSSQEEEEPESTEATERETGSDAELTLVEDQTTVDNGELLRASTFALTRDNTTTNTEVKYFPVTMYNYDQATINAATDALDSDLTLREGMYFSDGGNEVPSTVTTSTDLSAFVAGQYYIQNSRAAANGVGSWLVGGTNGITSTENQDNATLWSLVIEEGSYYLVSNGMYLTIGSGINDTCLSNTKNAISISTYSGGVWNSLGAEYYEGAVQLSQNDSYLVQFGGTNVERYGGYEVNNDTGNAMRFYRVEGDTQTLTTIAAGNTVVVSGYEVWNRWGYNSNDNTSQNKTYTGLAQSTLVDDQIVFNVNEGGIFNADTTVKAIYNYVGLPFVLDTETGVYTFDSDDNGVYFSDTDNDGDADPQSGTAQAPYNLYFDEGKTQGWSGMQYGDGSTNLWAPFNTNENDTGEGNIDYHFGMRADLPFSMTANGRVKSTDDTSTPISFSFKGDDDVWVYIDGHLVIDLGGIHNRLGAKIDFAANTITYFKPDTNNKDLPIGSHNDPDFAITQKLFTDSEGTGVINMTRDAFALDLDHEMQVFYLERGKGASNCQIQFNLPMNDTVLVTKDATQSWSQAAEEEDADSEGVSQLTAAEQAIVNNIDFGFTLYKKAADDEEFSPVANTNFYLIGRGVEGTVINQTDANGHFYLKNGQSAKFITEIPSDGVTYYVVEDKVPDGFVSPDFNFAGEAVFDYTYTDGTTTGTAPAADASQIPEQVIPLPVENDDGTLTWAENKSYEVTVTGSVEANDSIEFICSNYLDAELPNPTALAYEDIIVIDYGLPVNIDPLADDVFRGDSVEIIAFGGADLTLGAKTDKDGDGVYEENEQTITSDDTYGFGTVQFNDVTYAVDDKGNVTRDTLTYTLNKQLTEVEVLTYIIKVTGQEKQGATDVTLTQYDYAIGKIYIVPATVMYYEEDFSDLVTFKDGKGAWDANATTDASAVSPYQEPGVVGTIGDSTYGTDAAYLNDSGDSNGTSRHGDTTDGAIQFTYTFTGVGTSFFARTSATTGYMQVKLYNTEGEVINLTYRDTYYKDTNGTDEDSTGTLYNIPVYTQEDLEYGTYTVVATIAKAGTKGAGAMGDDGYQHSGKDFYLDGIRIVQPLNESNETIVNEETQETITDKALGAYATDGEANVDIVTLRYKLISDAQTEDNWNFVVLTDTNGQIQTAEEYASIGPKEEVYLMPGQSVSFSVKYWHKDGYLMHLGMKAPFGNAAAQVGQKTYELKNATDCYYNITDMQGSVVTETDQEGNTYYVATYTISATDKIVSLTNLKVTGNYEFVLIENTDIDFNGPSGEDNEG